MNEWQKIKQQIFLLLSTAFCSFVFTYLRIDTERERRHRDSRGGWSERGRKERQRPGKNSGKHRWCEWSTHRTTHHTQSSNKRVIEDAAAAGFTSQCWSEARRRNVAVLIASSETIALLAQEMDCSSFLLMLYLTVRLTQGTLTVPGVSPH